MFYALSGLKFSSGYNIPLTIQKPLYEENNFKHNIGIGMFTNIRDNVNISLGLILLSLLIGGILRLLVRFVIKNE